MPKRKTVAAKRCEPLVRQKIEKCEENRNGNRCSEKQNSRNLDERELMVEGDLKSLGSAGGYYHFSSCDSTNNILKKVSHYIIQRDIQSSHSILKPPSADDNICEDSFFQCLAQSELPLLITSDEQTAGRGRQSNTWWTGAGSLALSMLMDAKQHGLKPQTSAQLSLAIGYAAMQALRAITQETLTATDTVAMPNIEIRWPNDVYVNDRKITGILIEMPNMHHVIIGIGVNTNNTAADAPEEIRDRIVTLSDVLGQKIDQDRFIVLLWREIMEIFNHFPSQLPQLIAKVEANLFQIGKMVNISCENEQISGKCRGLNQDGSLRVLTETGEKAVVSGVIV